VVGFHAVHTGRCCVVRPLCFIPPRHARLRCGVGLATSIFLLTPAWAQARRIELDDLSKIVSVSDPQISPDGKSIVLVVSRQNLEQDRSDRELVLVDVASGTQRVLTSERKGVGSPRWSPSGDRLAFVAVTPAIRDSKEKDSKENKESKEAPGADAPQVFVLPMNGGEARKITNAPGGVEQFAWRPSGNEIAYVASDEPENKKEIEKHNDAFEVGDNDYLATAAPTPSHIWLVPSLGGDAKRLTSGAWSLPKSAPPSSPASPISWSPDGKFLTFTRQEHPHFGDSDLTTLQILNVDSGEIRKLTGHEKLESYGLFSPDGSRLAYWYPRDGDPNNVNEIYVTSATGGDGGDVTRKLDRNLFRAIWMPDGKSLLVGGHDSTQVALWLQPLQGNARKLSLGDVSPSWLFWIDACVSPKGAIAFAGSTPGQPSELYYMDSSDTPPRRLTNFNQHIAALGLGRVEKMEWQGPDSFREDGVLTYPPEFDKNKKYPLVLVIHGGPTAASTIAFGGLAQVLAAHDYLVFSPNYRGSDNLGNAYQRAIYNDAGDGPGRDVMAAIEAVKKLGFVDESKIAVSGWSYGGYMTSWMIAHYHIWKTAVAGASVTDLNEEYNLSDGNVGGRYSFKGSPWTGNMRDYIAQSPMAYASQIRTPTLILSDTGDARVPVTQSYQLFHALKDNGVTVKFIAYPVVGHFPGDPIRSRDVYSRWIAWVDQYLK